MKQALDLWRGQYDFIILDGAPVLPVTDSVVLSTQADATLLVARYQTTQQQSLEACVRMDYPHHTYVLDDGRRPEVEALAREPHAQRLVFDLGYRCIADE